MWEFAFDPKDLGLKEAWNDGRRLEKRIVVPFCPESVMSGIGDEGFHNICWYARNFDLPKNLRKHRLLLHFGAVDYQADIYLNGRHLGRHEGGYDSFEFDVSSEVRTKNNRLVLRAYDDPQQAKPRGKQSPERFPSGCAYMRVSGIWQTVWLEAVGPTFVNEWTLAADPDTGLLRVRATTDGPNRKLRLSAVVSQNGQAIASGAASVHESKTELLVNVPQPTPWSPDNPALYDLGFVLESDGKEIDRVNTYFGFRRIETRDGMCCLNGKPFFLISALDQGYHPLSLYTPRTDDEQRQDVEWAKRYGLNGIRKHQIVAEPRFHYWCDRLGLTEWGEMADWGASLDPLDQYLREWTACVKRDINHPCIITWVPTNERRPVDDRAIAEKIGVYEATKQLDPTRPVIDTSGYCHTKTDITDLHVNPRNGADCRKWWERWRKSIAETGNFPAYPDRPAFCKGFRHQGQPVIFSETGNWRITELPPMGFWTPYGYGPVPTVTAYISLYRDFFLALMTEPECAGFSYVQLYDVEGEVNGYLTYDRQPKVAPEIIAAIHAEGLRRRNEVSKPEASPK